MRSAAWVALLATALVSAPAAPVQAAARVTYCCNDARGVQVCGDIMPQACYGRAYWEIDPSGVVRRQVDAPMSAEERARREAEMRRKREEERRVVEQRRKDMALLNTYVDEADIVFQRDRKVRELEDVIAKLDERLQDELKKSQALKNEAEFYLKKPMPAELRKDIAANEADIAALRFTIANRRKDIEAVRDKYEEDRRRYLEITGSAPQRTQPASAPR